MQITIDEIEQELQKLLHGQQVVNHKGKPVFGRIIILSLANGKVQKIQKGEDCRAILQESVKWEKNI